MQIEEIKIYKLSPKKGYRFHSLENEETYSSCLFMKSASMFGGSWEEVVDPDYITEYDGSDYLYPVTWVFEMEVITGLWYTDGENTWEAIKSGIPVNFEDTEYFDII